MSLGVGVTQRYSDHVTTKVGCPVEMHTQHLDQLLYHVAHSVPGFGFWTPVTREPPPPLQIPKPRAGVFSPEHWGRHNLTARWALREVHRLPELSAFFPFLGRGQWIVHPRTFVQSNCKECNEESPCPRRPGMQFEYSSACTGGRGAKSRIDIMLLHKICTKFGVTGCLKVSADFTHCDAALLSVFLSAHLHHKSPISISPADTIMPLADDGFGIDCVDNSICSFGVGWTTMRTLIVLCAAVSNLRS